MLLMFVPLRADLALAVEVAVVAVVSELDFRARPVIY